MEYDVTAIKERIIKEFANRGERPYKVLPMLDLAKSTLDSTNKSMPKADTLAKIADYLGCSVDYLLGRNIEDLTDDEQQLVYFFRSCSDDDCQQLLRMAEMFANDEKQAIKKEGT